jgi:hypothetical protein
MTILLEKCKMYLLVLVLFVLYAGFDDVSSQQQIAFFLAMSFRKTLTLYLVVGFLTCHSLSA